MLLSNSLAYPWLQGRNGVRWRPGQEASLAPLWSNLTSFGSTSTVLKEVLVTFLGLFSGLRSRSSPPAVILCPRSDSAPGELCSPCPPRYLPAWMSFHRSWTEMLSRVRITFLDELTWIKSKFWRELLDLGHIFRNGSTRVCKTKHSRSFFELLLKYKTFSRFLFILRKGMVSSETIRKTSLNMPKLLWKTSVKIIFSPAENLTRHRKSEAHCAASEPSVTWFKSEEPYPKVADICTNVLLT